MSVCGCPEGRRHSQIAANRTRDRLVTRTLRARGRSVLRLWQHALKRRNAARLLRRLRAVGLGF